MASYTIQANQVNLKLQPDEDLTGTVSLSGATCTMVIVNPVGLKTTYACEIDPTFSFPYYITVGSEFPRKGIYMCQFIAVNGSDYLTSEIQTIRVLPNL